MNKFIVVIAGATGAGKTDFSLCLGQYIPIEIINADLGQFYLPLSIGTAKPDWQAETIKHHLFDIFASPQSFTSVEYRALVQELVEKIWARNKIPVIVGGSTFYIESLFFENSIEQTLNTHDTKTFPEQSNLWQELNELDPQRASEIHPHDLYRVRRALTIWRSTGIKPSEQKPFFNPIAPFYFYHITRDRQDLYNRINQRVGHMMQQGWIEEVSSLIGTPWEEFTLTKKFIGYPDIRDFIVSKSDNVSSLVEHIAQKTRNYAKKQETFWRRLEKKISNCLVTTPEYTNMMKSKIMICDLTYENLDVYSKQQAMMLQHSSESSSHE